MDFMTSLLGSQVGPICAAKMTERGFMNSGCASLGFSKLLGGIVILLSVIMKIPQIKLLMKNQSAEGLNVTSIMIETVAFNIITIFCFMNGQAFTTYGDTVFIYIQNLVMLFLIFKYKKDSPSIVKLVLGFISLNYYLLSEATETLLNTLMLLLLPLMLFGSFPQLAQNYRNRSAANLSPASTYIGYFSCLSRVYTNWVEVDSILAQVGSGLGAVINTILVYQVTVYSNTPTTSKADAKKKIN